MKLKHIRIALILIAVIILSVIAYRSYSAQTARTNLLTGTVEATRIDISAKESGTIEELLLAEGMEVHQGDIAARIRRNDLMAARLRDEAALAYAQAHLDRAVHGSRAEDISAAAARTRAARAAADKAAADYERGAQLLTEGAIAPQAFDALREEREASEANLRAAEQQEALLKNGSRPEDIRMAAEDVKRQQAILAIDDAAVGDLTVSVPADGVVLTKNYEPGEYVRAGAALATIIDPQDVWVKVYVTTDVLGDLRIGDAALVYIDGRAEPVNVTIKEISDAAEYTLRQSITKDERANLVFAVKVAVHNEDGALKPGMPADVDLDWHHAR